MAVFGGSFKPLIYFYVILVLYSLYCRLQTRAETSELSLIWRVKRQDDIVLWYTKLNKLIGNTAFCAIVLYPNLLVDNVNMNEWAMNPTQSVPAN